MSQLRKDPVTGRWALIAAEREKRPREFNHPRDDEGAEPCPFCTGNESLTPPEVWSDRPAHTRPDTPGWRVRIVPNKYPALKPSGEWRPGDDGFHRPQVGLGVHEVIIESPAHAANLAVLGGAQFTDFLRAYRNRLQDLSKDSRWRYLLIYKNQGERAGATLAHVHSQLIALPLVPREALDELGGAQRHYEAVRRCIYCDLIEREVRDRERIVSLSKSFVALCPFAPRFAYEIWILPRDHEATFVETSDRSLDAFARSLRDTITRLDRALNGPPFNYFIHSAPSDQTRSAHFHWHLEILPRLAGAAGFEWGAGAYMHSVAPESAAQMLREVAL